VLARLPALGTTSRLAVSDDQDLQGLAKPRRPPSRQFLAEVPRDSGTQDADGAPGRASHGLLSLTRDAIINYSAEPCETTRVKGSFLNARCGLTDSPPCPPTTPPPRGPLPRSSTADIPDAGAPPLLASGSPYVSMYEFAPEQILRRSGE